MAELIDVIREYEAKLRWNAGEDPKFTRKWNGKTGNWDILAGYGKQTLFQDFEFPLRPAEHYYEIMFSPFKILKRKEPAI